MQVTPPMAARVLFRQMLYENTGQQSGLFVSLAQSEGFEQTWTGSTLLLMPRAWQPSAICVVHFPQ